ncbi:MAG: hypothetical protein N2690_10715, partial [Rhodocyclaceae bacterium]|nr:hypothetical protein [Rhodocyclaceae bacterium]
YGGAWMIQSPMLAAAAALVAAVLGAAAGYRYATAHGEARLAECNAARAQDARLSSQKTAAYFKRSQDAESAAARLLAERDATSRRLEEAKNEVKRMAAGRQCLDADLRLRINREITGTDARLPENTGPALDAAAGAAADPGNDDAGLATSDADVASWALNAIELYRECTARIDALRQWDEVTHGR